MDLKQLDSIDTSNAAEVKKLQEFLRSRGFYKGPIDGKWGGGTTEGAVKLREELKDTLNTNLQISNNQREANDPVNNAIRSATEVGPYAAGATIGAGLGHLGAKGLKAQDAGFKDEAKRLAANPRIAGTVAEKQLGNMKGSRLASTLGQFAGPAAFLGSAEYIDREIAPKYEGETAKWIGLGANLDRGIGIGALGHQLFDLKNRFKSPVDPEDAGVIRTRAALEREPEGKLAKALQQQNAAPEAPPKLTPADTPPPPQQPMRHSDRLREAVTATGGKAARTKAANVEAIKRGLTAENAAAVAKSLNLPETADRKAILQRLREISTIGGKMAIPVAVGSYLAATGDSEAADATAGERATNAAGNFAVGAGGAYAGSKLVDALRAAAPTAMKALGGGLSMMAPGAAADMTDGLADLDPQKINEHDNAVLNSAVQSFPFNTELVRGLSKQHSDAYDIAQVPAPNPERKSMGPRLDDPRIQGRLRRMQTGGASPDQVAAFLNSAFAQ
jgi:hypothetical protein